MSLQVPHSTFYQDESLTCFHADLRGEEFLEGGEDAAIGHHHRGQKLHLLLALPHLHTCRYQALLQLAVAWWPSEEEEEVLLTISRSLLVNQDLGDRSSDQAVASVLLDGADDVEGDLAGAPLGVISASLVVVDQQGVDQGTGVLGWHP